MGFFLRHRDGETSWATVVAPGVGGLGLLVALVLMICNYGTLTGSDRAWVNSLPWLLPAAGTVGAVMAHRRLSRKAPANWACPYESGQCSRD